MDLLPCITTKSELCCYTDEGRTSKKEKKGMKNNGGAFAGSVYGADAAALNGKGGRYILLFRANKAGRLVYTGLQAKRLR